MTARDALRRRIFVAVDYAASGFLDYDRRDDEDLPRDAIERAITDGVVRIDEIADRFASALSGFACSPPAAPVDGAA